MGSYNSTQEDGRNRPYTIIDEQGESSAKDEADVTATTSQPTQSGNDIIEDEFADIDEILKDFDFPFENLILEGGGAQGNAYIGAIIEMEQRGYLEKLTRFGGASIGAFTACYLAVGHGPEKFLKILNEGPQIIDLLDASFGRCSMVPNLFRHMGWHPGKAIDKFLGDSIKEKLGNPDATFKDLYDKTGRELCVVVTNLSTMMEEYCHVKTTPDMPMRLAVRMSTSIPGVLFPVTRADNDRNDMYIDGGVICNYPVHCFDGWWLSMKLEDSFFNKIRHLQDGAKLLTKKQRFGGSNKKTFGMIIYSEYDSHVLPTNSDLEAIESPLPDTELVKAHREMKKNRKTGMEKHEKVQEAMEHFWDVLHMKDRNGDSEIVLKELQDAFKDPNEFTQEDILTLFGKARTADEVFKLLDANKDGKVVFGELMRFADKKGVGLHEQHIGSGRQNIRSPTEFATGIFKALLMNVKRAFLGGDDIERTVLINTVYYQSFDFGPQQEDLDFLVEQGRRGFLKFLKYHATKAASEQDKACST
ncbi:uncharacterized protein LOC100893728 [Strongylocentrotus purpuratus]|uniref:Uncharacterized protein n=1 Tax=Strongylocentrotus purpuratus TaxID=7668 RepID=A0A7M7LT96_STRPU|nr:uncharacterized protein LOC100893728 [Strongylocentrotus purpuratus]